MISKLPLASRICVLIFSTNKANHVKVEAYMAFPKRPKTTTKQHNTTSYEKNTSHDTKQPIILCYYLVIYIIDCINFTLHVSASSSYFILNLLRIMLCCNDGQKDSF